MILHRLPGACEASFLDCCRHFIQALDWSGHSLSVGESSLLVLRALLYVRLFGPTCCFRLFAVAHQPHQRRIVFHKWHESVNDVFEARHYRRGGYGFCWDP